MINLDLKRKLILELFLGFLVGLAVFVPQITFAAEWWESYPSAATREEAYNLAKAPDSATGSNVVTLGDGRKVYVQGEKLWVKSASGGGSAILVKGKESSGESWVVFKSSDGKFYITEESSLRTLESAEETQKELAEMRSNLEDKLVEMGDAGAIARLVFAQLVSLLFVGLGVVVYLIIDIVLVGRWVMLIFLTVLSPIPFILMILPATKKYAQMWWSKFVKWAVIGVLITFFLWLVPQVLATKNNAGQWESKSITTLNPLGPGAALMGAGWTAQAKIIYPSFLGGNMTSGEFIDGAMTFGLAFGFMIAAAWVAITLGETAGKIALNIPKFIGKAAKGTAKWGAGMTGVPGGIKGRVQDLLAKGALTRQKREAAVKEALGMKGARTAERLRQAMAVKKDMDERAQLATTQQRKGFFGQQKAGSVGQLAGALALAEYGELKDEDIDSIAAGFGDHRIFVDSLLRSKNKEKVPLSGVSPFKPDGGLKTAKEITDEKQAIAGNLNATALSKMKVSQWEDEDMQLGFNPDEALKLSSKTKDLVADKLRVSIDGLSETLAGMDTSDPRFNALSFKVDELRKRHAIVSGNPEASYQIGKIEENVSNEKLTNFVQTAEPKYLANMNADVLGKLASDGRFNQASLNTLGQHRGISPEKLKSVVKGINEQASGKLKDDLINYLRSSEFWKPYQGEQEGGEGRIVTPPFNK